MVSGTISEQDIQKVRESADIVALFAERTPVKQKGRDFWCCCPIHNEKTPSCKIDPALQLWHCFGCGAGGDVFGYLMKAEDMSFPEAVRFLAEKYHVQITETRQGGIPQGERSRLKDVCREAAEFFHTQLMRGKSPEAQAARDYLAGRGLGGKVPKSWQLGFAPGNGSLQAHLRGKGFTPKEMVAANVCVESNGRVRDRFFNRIMFPIRDAQGAVIAFGGRVMGDGQPKYLNSNETPLFHKSQVLFGLDTAKNAITASGVAVVVEGYTDVILLQENGIGNAVATLGTALTRQHIRLLGRFAKKRIVYLFDGDAAGIHAAERALEFIDETASGDTGASSVELCAVVLPDNLDPADFVMQRGASQLLELLESAPTLLQFGIDRILAEADTRSAESRSRAMAAALKILAPIKGTLVAKDYALQLAGRLRVREQDALDMLSKVQAPRAQRAEDQGQEPQEVLRERPHLTLAERNRLRFERELLCSWVARPDLLLDGAALSVQWRHPKHAAIAEAFDRAKAEGGADTPSSLLECAETAVPGSVNALTASRVDAADVSEKLVVFLLDELKIGDMQDTIFRLRRDAAEGSESDEFGLIAALQKDLDALCRKHAANG